MVELATGGLQDRDSFDPHYRKGLTLE